MPSAMPAKSGGCPKRSLQLAWADWRGHWPWVSIFDDGRGTQPVLGRRTAAS